MQKGLPKLIGAMMFMLLMLSFLVATPASAACGPRAGECLAPPYAIPPEPVWATLNAIPQGNYPGGNVIFDVFVINTGWPAQGNVTLINETLTAPALPAASQTNTATGLPVQLSPGQGIVSTIALQLPSNFTQSTFTASLEVNVRFWNGTANLPLQLKGNSLLYTLGPPASSTQSTTSASQGTQPPAQGGTISMTIFAAGIATPSIVAILLLVVLFRRRSLPKGGT